MKRFFQQKFPIWFFVVPLMLFSAMPVVFMVDEGSLNRQEFNSVKHLIWSGNRAQLDNDELRDLSLSETIESVQTLSPNHVPAYMIQLSVWSDLVGYNFVVLRSMSFFCFMLSLAMLWQFTRTLFDYQSAFFATFILAFAGFYIYYGHEIRMYSLVVMQCIGILWSYWRIIISRKPTRFYHWLALFGWSVYGIYTHMVVLFVVGAIGFYHLIFARKDRQWIYVGVVEGLAGVLFLPWLLNTVSSMSSITDISATVDLTASNQTVIEVIIQGLFVYSNGFWFGALLLMGIVIWKRSPNSKNLDYILVTLCATVTAMLIVNELVAYLPEQRMRYTLIWLPMLAIIWGIGLRLVYQVEQWIGWGILSIWLVMLVWFNSSENFYVISNLEHQEFEEWFPYQLVGDQVRDNYDHILGYEAPLVTFNSQERPDPGTNNYYEEIYQHRFEYLSLPITDIDAERLDKIDNSFPGFWFSYRVADEEGLQYWKTAPRVKETFDRYEQCISLGNEEEIYLFYYLDNRVPCKLIYEGDQVVAVYQNDYVLRNYVVEYSDSQVEVSLLWNTLDFVFDGAYAFSIQVFHDDEKVGQTDYPIDNVVTHQTVDVDWSESGVYVVKLFVYSSADVESVGGETDTGLKFDRGIEIGRINVESDST